jgi:hypothetical protein
MTTKTRKYKRHIISWAVVNRYGEHACFARPTTYRVAVKWASAMRQGFAPEGRRKDGPFYVVRIDGFVMAYPRPRKHVKP